MDRISLFVGAILLVLGLGFYFGTGMVSGSALAPVVPGLGILICGIVVLQKPGARKHAMHVAMVFAVLGILGGSYPVVKGLTGDFGNAAIESLLMMIFCAVYLGLGIKSFVDARKAGSSES